nr:Chain B, Histone H3 [Saccharomyces cerevisiae]
KSTGGKAPRKQ